MKTPLPPKTDPAHDAWRLMFGILMRTNGSRQESLTKRNLTPNDSRALYTLDRSKGTAIGALARLWGCDPSTATWVVDRLEKAGLAERRPSPTDRRVKFVALTEKGEAMSRELLAEFHQPPEMMNNLDAEELATLKALLQKMAGKRASGELDLPA